MKALWHRLVAGSLVRERDELERKLERQVNVTREHADRWVRSDQQVGILQRTVDQLRTECAAVATQLHEANKALASEDAAIVMSGVRQALGGDKELRGQLDILRQRLTAELAYGTYLEEHRAEGVTPFNELPLETRKEYFERVKEQVR